MLNLFGIATSFFLIALIFIRTPQDSVGLGSPRSVQQFLDFLTAIGIVLYILIAFKLNLMNN